MSAATSFDAQGRAFADGRYVRVVNYHNTPSSMADNLERELSGYASRFAAVSLEDLDRFFETGGWNKDRPGLLPVFYEGYRNNAEVAAPICDQIGLVAWFFVVTSWIDAPVFEQRAFADAHSINLVEEDLASDRLAMTRADLAELAERHVVTAHTGSHVGINEIGTEEDFDREVYEPMRTILEATGRASPCFAWLWGTPWGVSVAHDDALVRAGYRYLFSNTMIQRLPHP